VTEEASIPPLAAKEPNVPLKKNGEKFALPRPFSQPFFDKINYGSLGPGSYSLVKLALGTVALPPSFRCLIKEPASFLKFERFRIPPGGASGSTFLARLATGLFPFWEYQADGSQPAVHGRLAVYSAATFSTFEQLRAHPGQTLIQMGLFIVGMFGNAVGRGFPVLDNLMLVRRAGAAVLLLALVACAWHGGRMR
jgi:hypothetical protein